MNLVAKMGKQVSQKELVKYPAGQVKCPYLLSRTERICLSMVESVLDSEVSSFDVKHFCNGNPVHCYYYRFAPSNGNGFIEIEKEGRKGKLRVLRLIRRVS